MALPDFLLVGAPKAGTTALHVALARHPDLFPSRNKEPKFFLTDGTEPAVDRGPGDAPTSRKIVWREQDYEALFDEAPEGALRAESTTLYLRDTAAHQRIRQLVPDAKLIAVVRDPIDRAHSNWTHLRSAGLEPEGDFLRACALEESRAAGRLGAVLAVRRAGPVPASNSSICSRSSRESRCSCCATGSHGVPGPDPRPGLRVPWRPDRAACRRCPRRTSRPRSLRPGSTARCTGRLDRRPPPSASKLPGRLGDRVSAPAVRALQREQRTREPLTTAEREALLPVFLPDIELLESVTHESFGDWRDLHNGRSRSPLVIEGKFGTGFRSIDRPLGRLIPY